MRPSCEASSPSAQDAPAATTSTNTSSPPSRRSSSNSVRCSLLGSLKSNPSSDQSPDLPARNSEASPSSPSQRWKLGNPRSSSATRRKKYGTAKQVEGEVNQGDVVVFVEDVATTGGQALEAVGNTQSAGREGPRDHQRDRSSRRRDEKTSKARESRSTRSSPSATSVLKTDYLQTN